MQNNRPFSIAFYMPNLDGGGAERVVLTLAGALAARGHHVDLLLNHVKGERVDSIPANIRTHILDERSTVTGIRKLFADWPAKRLSVLRQILTSSRTLKKLRRLPALTEYLAREAPDALICTLGYTPFLAYWASVVTGVSTQIYAREENCFSAELADRTQGKSGRRRRSRIKGLMKTIYPHLDGVIAVSDGVRDDLLQLLDLPPEAVTTIYNPVVSSDIATLRKRPCNHPWFKEGTVPVILGAGRLHPQKNFTMLIDAFARVRERVDARLVILGEGSDRKALQAKVGALGLQSQVSLPGWVGNPYSFMARSAVFVLSSRYEGFGLVLVEAMACGCPVVSTDCPSGPNEILLGGRLGMLVSVDEVSGLADAIIKTIENPPAVQELQNRAADFSVERSVTAHTALVGKKGK